LEDPVDSAYRRYLSISQAIIDEARRAKEGEFICATVSEKIKLLVHNECLVLRACRALGIGDEQGGSFQFQLSQLVANGFPTFRDIATHAAVAQLRCLRKPTLNASFYEFGEACFIPKAISEGASVEALRLWIRRYACNRWDRISKGEQYTSSSLEARQAHQLRLLRPLALPNIEDPRLDCTLHDIASATRRDTGIGASTVGHLMVVPTKLLLANRTRVMTEIRSFLQLSKSSELNEIEERAAEQIYVPLRDRALLNPVFSSLHADILDILVLHGFQGVQNHINVSTIAENILEEELLNARSRHPKCFDEVPIP